jgi:hypothetical protein
MDLLSRMPAVGNHRELREASVNRHTGDALIARERRIRRVTVFEH